MMSGIADLLGTLGLGDLGLLQAGLVLFALIFALATIRWGWWTAAGDGGGDERSSAESPAGGADGQSFEGWGRRWRP